MPDYAENGLALSWDEPASGAGALAQMVRALVRVSPAHPSNAVRGLYSFDRGAPREARGFPIGLDPASGAQIFALDLPQPPDGTDMTWRPVASCGNREVDPARGRVASDPARGRAALRTADATPPAAVSPERVEPCHPARFDFKPVFLFRVTAPVYRDDDPVGETPDGLRMLFALRGGGYVKGPALNGPIEHKGGDWMRVRPDGIGVCAIHALIKPEGGGVVLTEYSGLVDFGPNSYAHLAAGGGPRRAPLRFAPRYLTDAPHLEWLNRLQCLSIGQVDLERFVVEYDLYAFAPLPSGAPGGLADG